MGATKLLTAAGGGITLDAASTATDKTITVPADNGTLVYANSSGNVGIGTSSPSYKLQVSGTASTDANADLTGSQFVVNGIAFRQRGNSAGISGVTYAKQIYASGSPDVMEIYNASNYALIFGTNATERARIDSSGNLLVGRTDANFTTGSGITMLPSQGICITKTSTANVGAGLYIQRVSGIGTGNLCEWAYNGSTVGVISTNGSSTSYVTTSDYRLKENVLPMQGAMATVAQLKPCTYTWKANGETTQGFIAHELQAVVPDAVVGEKDAVDADGNPVYQGIDTSFLVATLTAAIQELSAKNDALEARLALLENK